MNKARERELAREIFINSRKTPAQVANQVGVTEKTLVRWATEGNWEVLRQANTITRDSLLRKAYDMLRMINEQIELDGGMPNKKQNDAKNTVIREIQALDRQDSLSVHVMVMEKFLAFTQARNPELARQISGLQMEFLEQRSYESAQG